MVNLDYVAYESVMMGLFSIWRGHPRTGRPKVNEGCVGYSRDGFYWRGRHLLVNADAPAERPVRLRFYATHGRRYAFWVSADASGASRGYVDAGGPGFPRPRDTLGKETSQ